MQNHLKSTLNQFRRHFLGFGLIFCLYLAAAFLTWHLIALMGEAMAIPTPISSAITLVSHSIETALYLLFSIRLCLPRKEDKPSTVHIAKQGSLIGLGSALPGLVVLSVTNTGGATENAAEQISVLASLLTTSSLLVAMQIAFYGVIGGFTLAGDIAIKNLTLAEAIKENKISPPGLAKETIVIFMALITIALLGTNILQLASFSMAMASLAILITGPFTFCAHQHLTGARPL